MEQTTIIKAVKVGNHWVLVQDIAGVQVCIGEECPIEYPTRKAAYEAAEKMWPANGVWRGKRVKGGYRITL